LWGLAVSPTALTPSVALSAPTMLGVNFTVYVHDLPPPASELGQVPPVTAKSVKLGPVMLSLSEAAAPPSLITVTVPFVDECPLTTVPKAMLAGTTRSGVNPVPLRPTAGGPPLGSSATPIESAPLSALSVLGVNVTAYVQLDKAANELPQLPPVTAKSPGLAPLMLVPVSVIDPPAALLLTVMSTVFEAVR